MHMTAEQFLKEIGLEEPLAPGQIKYKKVPGDKPGTSFTLVYDWKTDPYKIRVEMRPGLTGMMPDKKDLSKFALWLQTLNFWELDLSQHKNKTKH
jgi:hypothetical protein